MEGRRGFIRGGAAASALLGSLASQPVLGRSLVICTPSGRWSGNLSYRDEGQCDVGYGPDEWLSKDWLKYQKGTVSSVGSETSTIETTVMTTTGGKGKGKGNGKGTGQDKSGGDSSSGDTSSNGAGGGSPTCEVTGDTFNDVFGVVWFFIDETSCQAVVGSEGVPATLLQVLQMEPNSAEDHFAREAVAALLNAADIEGFPLNEMRVTHMVREVRATGSYVPAAFASNAWGIETVTRYLQTLHSDIRW